MFITLDLIIITRVKYDHSMQENVYKIQWQKRNQNLIHKYILDYIFNKVAKCVTKHENVITDNVTELRL